MAAGPIAERNQGMYFGLNCEFSMLLEVDCRFNII